MGELDLELPSLFLEGSIEAWSDIEGSLDPPTFLPVGGLLICLLKSLVLCTD